MKNGSATKKIQCKRSNEMVFQKWSNEKFEPTKYFKNTPIKTESHKKNPLNFYYFSIKVLETTGYSYVLLILNFVFIIFML